MGKSIVQRIAQLEAETEALCHSNAFLLSHAADGTGVGAEDYFTLVGVAFNTRFPNGLPEPEFTTPAEQQIEMLRKALTDLCAATGDCHAPIGYTEEAIKKAEQVLELTR